MEGHKVLNSCLSSPIGIPCVCPSILQQDKHQGVIIIKHPCLELRHTVKNLELWKVLGAVKCVRRDSKVSFLSEDITSFMLTTFVSGLG